MLIAPLHCPVSGQSRCDTSFPISTEGTQEAAAGDALALRLKDDDADG